MENFPEPATGRPNLFVRHGDQINDASAADQAVAAMYSRATDKGPVVDGYRLTLLAAKSSYKVGETARIIHVCESMAPEAPLYVMGPKPVQGEYVDGQQTTPQAPSPEHPLVPASYDGRVLSGPGIDFNFDITEYTFEDPGLHTVRWGPGPWASNTLVLRFS